MDIILKILIERITNSLINQLINYEGVYRTAPATPGLLKHEDKTIVLKYTHNY